MERSILTRFAPLFCIALTLFGVPRSSARADIIPGYTVTDLGTGTAQVSTDADGNGIVIAPDGQRTYTFPNTNNHLANLQSVLPLVPPLNNAPIYNPMTYGDPNNAYSRTEDGFLNQNGLFVGRNIYGVAGHAAGAGSVVFASQRQSDGSFGSLNILWGSPNNYSTSGQIAEAKFLNNQDQVLGMGGVPYGPNSYYAKNFYLFDMKSNTRTDLKELLPSWQLDSELGLDDQGRILLFAHQWDQQSGAQYHSLLLTPSNLLLSDPVTVPEPTSLATLMLGMGYLVFRRSRRHEAQGAC
ncbi:PEP-CTERM sorting domain-containing protein [Singulisphaera acidiphila]|uniref:PEP-CTERM putative exosortase interaction domain-containing protein n=1 Tax=Singulisphaera acidiphila (strain ATCC BAA-1392 / DSM 18658 / VKM B-2454 / MOB10) TaxID=886293 RepID=L0DQX0_SINAD|nr:PEP-CTERM sorting domain-containing protein [Singulisphaera acidiphila]AGA31385.1 PEP-CTERM putative exosortase interaction domain-containing protein [Singulisphaera acidiphila DSM 18658]